MENLLNIHQVANILGLKKITVYEWVKTRRIPYVKLGRRVLFDPQDIRRLIEQNKIEVSK